MERIRDGYFLGVHHDETARVVGGVLSGWRLHNHEVVDLTTGNHIEREGATVGLRTGHGTAIDPHVVVALLQAAHHHKLVVDEAHARNAAYHFAGIGVLGALNFLRRHVVHHIGATLGLLDGGRLGVGAPHGGYGELTQLAVGCALHLLGGVGHGMGRVCFYL